MHCLNFARYCPIIQPFLSKMEDYTTIIQRILSYYYQFYAQNIIIQWLCKRFFFQKTIEWLDGLLQIFNSAVTSIILSCQQLFFTVHDLFEIRRSQRSVTSRIPGCRDDMRSTNQRSEKSHTEVTYIVKNVQYSVQSFYPFLSKRITQQ